MTHNSNGFCPTSTGGLSAQAPEGRVSPVGSLGIDVTCGEAVVLGEGVEECHHSHKGVHVIRFLVARCKAVHLRRRAIPIEHWMKCSFRYLA